MDWSTAFGIIGLILTVGLAVFVYKIWCGYRALRQLQSILIKEPSAEKVQAMANYLRQRRK